MTVDKVFLFLSRFNSRNGGFSLSRREEEFFLEKPFLRRLFLRWKARRPFAKTVPSVPKIFELHRETVRKVDPEFFSSISINFPKPGTERNFVSYESA